jgi:predicted amidophosphoribosyltransferase
MTLPQEWRDRIWNVPPVGTSGACRICHGVVSPTHQTDYKCGQVWSHQPGYFRIRLIVPCSVAVADSDWYRALQTYKAGSFDQYAPLLANVLSEWLAVNGRNVTSQLGHKPDLVTVVPSKKVPHPAPLWDVLKSIPGLQSRLTQTLTHQSGQGVGTGRDTVISEQFTSIEDVNGKAIVLIDDTWVTGQTSVGAALALAAAGAAHIAIITLARMVYPDSYTAEYEEAAFPPHQPSWPK